MLWIYSGIFSCTRRSTILTAYPPKSVRFYGMQLQESLPKELDNIPMYLVRISIIYCNLSASKHYPDVPLLINFNQPFVVVVALSIVTLEKKSFVRHS